MTALRQAQENINANETEFETQKKKKREKALREAQALIKRENVSEFITRLDELITKADSLADSMAQELKNNKKGK